MTGHKRYVSVIDEPAEFTIIRLSTQHPTIHNELGSAETLPHNWLFIGIKAAGTLSLWNIRCK